MKLTKRQLRKLIKEEVSDRYKTTVTDPAVFEDPSMIMDQFQKLSEAMSIIHENVKMTLDKIESLETKMEVVEEILDISET